jgi:hypothetical protein
MGNNICGSQRKPCESSDMKLCNIKEFGASSNKLSLQYTQQPLFKDAVMLQRCQRCGRRNKKPRIKLRKRPFKLHTVDVEGSLRCHHRGES